jgi:hypothetical protein
MTVLDEAARLTATDRNRDYGEPIDNHGTTAALWAAWLKRRHGIEIPLTAEDVCFLNALQKLSRLANKVTFDGLVDVAGYARNVEMVVDARRTVIDAVGTDGCKATVGTST